MCSIVAKAPPAFIEVIQRSGLAEVLDMEMNTVHDLATNTGAKPSGPSKRLLSSPDNIISVNDAAAAMGIPDLAARILQYAKTNGLTGPKGLPEDLDDLGNCVLQRYKMLRVPVQVFQDPDSYVNHNIRCTGSDCFCGAKARNDPVWIGVDENVTTGDLGGRLPAFLRGLMKLRGGKNNSYRLAVVEVLWPMNKGRADPCDTLVRVHRRVYKSAMGGIWVINIRSVMAMAHLVSYGEGRWLVNNRIDLKTWNDTYMGLESAI